MSTATVNVPPSFVERVVSALTTKLRDVGIEATVDSQPVGGGTKLHRIYVIANGFEELSHSERQSLVWRIAERELSPDEQIKVSMILTLTPAESGSEGDS